MKTTDSLEKHEKYVWSKMFEPSFFAVGSALEFYFLRPILILYFLFLTKGASSGIGAETARVLALRGVHVTMAVRNLDAGRNVKEEIIKQIPSAKINAMELDLSSMASVRKFASDYNSSGLPLNILM